MVRISFYIFIALNPSSLRGFFLVIAALFPVIASVAKQSHNYSYNKGIASSCLLAMTRGLCSKKTNSNPTTNRPFTDLSQPIFRLGWCGNDNPSQSTAFHSIRRSGDFLFTFSSRKKWIGPPRPWAGKVKEEKEFAWNFCNEPRLGFFSAEEKEKRIIRFKNLILQLKFP